MASAAARFLASWSTHEVPARADYAEVLTTTDRPYVRSAAGVLLGIVMFYFFANVVTQGLLWLFWTAGDRSTDFAASSRIALRFENPPGMLAAHLGLAMLIPISMWLVLAIHRSHPKWLASVLGRLRWDFLGLAAVASLVLFSGALALRQLGLPTTWQPQPGFIGFLVVIVLTSPLQAAAEEVFFRGYLLQALRPLVAPPWFGVGASALLFALFHGTQNLPLFLDRFAFGLLAATLVIRTGGLEAAIGAHAVNNVLAFTTAGLWSTIAQVKAVQQVGWVDMAWDISTYAAFAGVALLMARRRRLAVVTLESARGNEPPRGRR